MEALKDFARNKRGSLWEVTALVAAGVTLVGVGAAIGLDRLTHDGDLPQIAIFWPANRLPGAPPTSAQAAVSNPAPLALDDTPVGSIPARLAPIRLDPCTAVRK